MNVDITDLVNAQSQESYFLTFLAGNLTPYLTDPPFKGNYNIDIEGEMVAGISQDVCIEYTINKLLSEIEARSFHITTKYWQSLTYILNQVGNVYKIEGDNLSEEKLVSHTSTLVNNFANTNFVVCGKGKVAHFYEAWRNYRVPTGTFNAVFRESEYCPLNNLYIGEFSHTVLRLHLNNPIVMTPVDNMGKFTVLADCHFNVYAPNKIHKFAFVKEDKSVEWKKEGLCIKCGDKGEFRGLACMCRNGHGKIFG
jgi:hypothetical protein